MIEYLISLEQKKYPFFDIVQINVLSSNDNIIEYRVKIQSRLDAKWSKWEPTKKINLSKLIKIARDEKINKILE